MLLPDTAQRKLGTLLCISLIVNKIIGTGIFLNPSLILQYCGGNVGLFLLLFLIGGVVIFCGLLIYLEYALNLPFRNGGEKNYILRVFSKPKGLVGCLYAFTIVILGFSSGNSYAFGKYVLYAATNHHDGDEINDSLVKLIGVACITFCVLLHIQHPNHGTRLFNILGVLKILILVAIIVLGAAVPLGYLDVAPTKNFHDMWRFADNHSSNLYGVAVGLLEVIYSFKGWENVNYVLSEIEDPAHVLTIAAPSAVLLTTVLYFMVIISYLLVIPKQEILDSGVLVAGIFFSKVFGESIASRLLPVVISLSNLGNVLVVSYAHSVVNQELALNNYLPFSNVFADLKWSLVLHWFVTVVILVAPPSSEIYEFIVNLYIYPGTWINILLTVGLIYLKLNRKKEKWGEFNDIRRDWDQKTNQSDPTVSVSSETDLLLENKPLNTMISTPYICVFIFLAANIFLALFPFVPPQNAADLDIPYWCFPVIGSLVFLVGAAFYYVRGWYGEPKYEEDYKEE